MRNEANNALTLPRDPYTSSSKFDGRDRLTEIQTARGTVTRFGYEDGTNRLIDTIRVDLAGNEAERHHVTYDLAGNKDREEDQTCSTPAVTCTTWSILKVPELLPPLFVGRSYIR